MRIRTKIVCTIGPAVNTLEKMIALIDAGMSVARLNFSHGTHETHRENIALLKEARKRTGQPLAIMLDTKGPEIRVGHLKEAMEVHAGQLLTLVPGPVAEEKGQLPVVPAAVLQGLERGMQVLFDDGYVTSQVVNVIPEGVQVEIQCDGVIGSQKGINVPDAVLDIPLVTESDIADILFGCEEDVDMVAASFVIGPEQILKIKKMLVDAGKPDIRVVAKIETSRGVKNFDEILQVVEGIMIARGDLGVEMPLAKVPGLQKMMIVKCYQAGKPSIVATQMLESMIKSPRPTRAEASDVANGIFDSASAVMLSGETAAGKYPIQAVQVMRSIVQEAEAEFDYEGFFVQRGLQTAHDVPSALSIATLRTAIGAKAAAIFIITSTGRSARLLSRLHPRMPIIALTTSEKSYHQLAFSWGVVPVYAPECHSIQEGMEILSDWALENDYVHYGDLIVLTAGVPFGIAGTTNMMMVESIGDVAVRGQEGYGARTVGNIEIIYDIPAAIEEGVKDKILVLTRVSDEALPLLKASRGVILQNHFDDMESSRYLLLVAKALDLPVLTGADSAIRLLKPDQQVTLDPQTRVVYRGTLE